MTPRDIIARAWAITLQHRSVRRWSFTAAFLETLLDVKLLGYQAYFMFSILYHGEGVGFFDVEIMLYEYLPFGVFASIILFFLLLVVVEFFMPHFCRGAIIGLTAKAYKGEPLKGGFVLGMYNFFPLFALHEFLFLSSWATVITLISLIARYINEPVKSVAIGMVIFFWLISSLLKFILSFADQAVVVKKMGIFEAIGRSFKLIISHLGQIMFLVLLLLVISIRILINTAVIVVLPAIIIGIALLLGYILSPFLSWLIAGIIGMALIIVVSYFFAYLYTFKLAVWTIAFLEYDSHKDLDVIE